MKIYNNNPAFGDCGPWDVEAETFEAACSQCADEMQSSFVEFAAGYDYSGDDTEEEIQEYRREHVVSQRKAFIESLTQILHCDECGEDFHADAPERGHADDCCRRYRRLEEAR